MNLTPSNILTEELYNKLIAAKTNKERASLLVTAKSRDSDNMTDAEFEEYRKNTQDYSKRLHELGIDLNKESDLSDTIINMLFGKFIEEVSEKEDILITTNTIMDSVKYVEDALKGNLNTRSKELVSKITDKNTLDKLIENIKCTRGL